jgi:hypothetical protein
VYAQRAARALAVSLPAHLGQGSGRKLEPARPGDLSAHLGGEMNTLVAALGGFQRYARLEHRGGAGVAIPLLRLGHYLLVGRRAGRSLGQLEQGAHLYAAGAGEPVQVQRVGFLDPELPADRSHHVGAQAIERHGGETFDVGAHDVRAQTRRRQER